MTPSAVLVPEGVRKENIDTKLRLEFNQICISVSILGGFGM